MTTKNDALSTVVGNRAEKSIPTLNFAIKQGWLQFQPNFGLHEIIHPNLVEALQSTKCAEPNGRDIRALTQVERSIADLISSARVAENRTKMFGNVLLSLTSSSLRSLLQILQNDLNFMG
jgi:hypothetical protein